MGAPFFDAVRAAPPGDGADIGAGSARHAARKISLRLRDPDRTPVTGTAIWLADGDGMLVNLSFGIAVVDAVARFGLAGSDFAATDLTLEMLYLVEANVGGDGRGAQDSTNGCTAPRRRPKPRR